MDSWSDETREQQLRQAYARLPGADYYAVLGWIHQILRPKTYIELGVRHGASLSMALPETICLGVDPNPCIALPLPPLTQLFRMTSDEFFRSNLVESCLETCHCDLAFIDGSHLFEEALRDFVHIERLAGPASVIALHDCIPLDDLTSARVRTTQFYSGDAWKVVAVLRRHRPDLRIGVVPTPPTGLCLVTNLKPRSDLLVELYPEIVPAFQEIQWSNYLKRTDFISQTVENRRSAVEAFLEPQLRLMRRADEYY